MIFNSRLQYISKVNTETVNQWCTNFIRSKSYLLTNQQRFAPVKHGNICPLIDVSKLVPTLTASWSFKLLIQGQPLLFSESWYRYFTQAAKHHKFRSVDHMLNCATTKWDTMSLERFGNKIPVFAHQSLINLCMMGFKREPSMVFEDLMNQHIFGNRHILNPTTGGPWDRAQTPFSTITPYRMTIIADLYFTFDQNRYKRDPQVDAVVPLDLANANRTFSTHRNRLLIHV